MKTILFYTSVAALCIATSCKSIKQASIKDLSGEWSIISVNGEAVSVPGGQDQPFIGFDTENGRIFGNTSCNSIMGNINTSLPDGKIDLSGIASTRMACPDMSLEQNIFKAMSEVEEYKLSTENRIELCDGKGNPMLVLEKRKPTLSNADLDGEWTIKELDGKKLDKENKNYRKIYFDLSDKTFSCTTSCNSMSGIFQSNANDISFGAIAQTEMACENMETEQTLAKVLPEIRFFGHLANGDTGFYNQYNDLLMVIGK